MNTIKIAYCSDLHIEFGTLDIKNTEGADVLVLAGDIFVTMELYDQKSTAELFLYRSERIHKFIEECCSEFPRVVMICGNHEHYHSNIERDYEYIKNCLVYENFHLLENRVVEIGDVLFVGSTMWTDMNREDTKTITDIKQMMNDFRIIGNGDRKFTPDDCIVRFREAVDYIDLMTVMHRDRKIVVITHHAPSFRSINPIYENEIIMNGGFCSNLESFIMDRDNIVVWIHGHLHNKSDYMIGDTRILCNPRGYPKENLFEKFKLEYVDV